MNVDDVHSFSPCDDCRIHRLRAVVLATRALRDAFDHAAWGDAHIPGLAAALSAVDAACAALLPVDMDDDA